MAVKGRDKAHRLVSNAREGIIKYGHLGLNKVIERKLLDARAQLDGREDFLKCHEIRQALSANIETFAAAARDPSVEYQAAMVEGVNELLQKCVPLYHTLISNQSLAKACDAIKAAEAALDAWADEDEDYKKQQELNGGYIRNKYGKRVKLNAKDLAAWQADNKRGFMNYQKNPYGNSDQTTAEHDKAFIEGMKKNKKKSNAFKKRTRKTRDDDEEPTPPELRMAVKRDGMKKYNLYPNLFRFAPTGTTNCLRTKEAAMELAALCVARRPAGSTLKEKRAKNEQKGIRPGVVPMRDGFIARVMPKNKTVVTLAAPGGGYLFVSADKAGDAMDKWEKKGKPCVKSDPLVHGVRRE